MSTKHLRRLLAEKEDKGKDAEVHDEGEEVEEEEETDVNNTPRNRFELLEDAAESEGNDGEGEVKDEKQETNKKKRTNKNKKRKKQQKKEDEHAEDDLLNGILTGESWELGDGSATVVMERAEVVEIERVFRVDPRQFDASAELRRILGKAFRLEARSSENNRGGPTSTKRLGRIVQAKNTWPQLKGLGLSMELEKTETSGVRWFGFVHSTAYQAHEQMCKMAESTLNMDMVMTILQSSPYHLDSLLLAANLFRMQEDVTQAADCIERAIFACDMSSHALFNPCAWADRLDYAKFENRSFFLLIHRHVLNADVRKCYQTALNLAKLLFSLDPQSDPLAAILLLDSLALKARAYDWLQQAYTVLNKWKNLDLLPNWRFSMALKAFQKEESNADELLLSAITDFPAVLYQLLEQLQIELDPQTAKAPALSAGAFEREPECMRLLAKAYAQQSLLLWKSSTSLAWLERVVTSIGAKLGARAQDVDARENRTRRFARTAPAIARGVSLLGVVVPTRSRPGDGAGSTSSPVTDPAPTPANSRSGYAYDNRILNENARPDSFISGLLHSLHPEFDDSEHLMDVVARGLRGLMAAVGGGQGGQGGGGEGQAERPREERPE